MTAFKYDEILYIFFWFSVHAICVLQQPVKPSSCLILGKLNKNCLEIRRGLMMKKRITILFSLLSMQLLAFGTKRKVNAVMQCNHNYNIIYQFISFSDIIIKYISKIYLWSIFHEWWMQEIILTLSETKFYNNNKWKIQ